MFRFLLSDTLLPSLCFDEDGGGGGSAPPATTPPAATAPPADPGNQTPPDPATPPETPLPPDQQTAFNKRLGAAMVKQEQEIRARVEADHQARLAQMQPPPTPPQMTTTSEDAWDDAAEKERVNEELLNEFYSDPLGAMAKATRILAERKAAHEQRVTQDWKSYADYMAQRYPDFEQVRPRMLELTKAHPHLATKPQELERLYELAKSPAFGAPAAPNTDALLTDAAFMGKAQERLLQDPAFVARVKESMRAQILEEYTTGKVNNAPPPLMGNSPGGSAPAVPPNTPKTWGQAKANALARQGTR